MDREQQSREVDQNYYAFQRVLGSILAEHRNDYALMRDRAIVGYYASAGDAFRKGRETFADNRFSIQEVTDEPIDLGFFSHIAG